SPLMAANATCAFSCGLKVLGVLIIDFYHTALSHFCKFRVQFYQTIIGVESQILYSLEKK
ncbi:MAG: hypothetical protein ABIE46_00230, partial [Patescibacteria group bacterium]